MERSDILDNVTSIRSFSVAERKKNLGGGFWIKAVTGYLLLADVYVFLLGLSPKLLKRIKFCFLFWGKGKRGIKGVNSLYPKTPYYNFLVFAFELTLFFFLVLFRLEFFLCYSINSSKGLRGVSVIE